MRDPVSNKEWRKIAYDEPCLASVLTSTHMNAYTQAHVLKGGREKTGDEDYWSRS